MTEPTVSEPDTILRSPAANLILAYGDQKSGKTTLLSKLPLGFKVHVIDFDGGLVRGEGVLKRYTDRGGDEANFTVVQPIDFGETHAAMWHLPPDHNIYVLDTYTTAMKRFKTQVTGLLDVKPSDVVDWRKIGGSLSYMAIEYLDRWRDQVASVGAWGLILCQDKLKGDEGALKLGPDLIGACARDAAAMPSFLLHLEYQTVNEGGYTALKRVLRTAGSTDVMAGDRSGILDTFEPADLGALIEKVSRARGLYNAGDSPSQGAQK